MLGGVTTGNITVGGAITTGVYTVGATAATGNTIYRGTQTTGTNSLFDNTTTANTTMFAGVTTGTITIAGAVTTGNIAIGAAGANGNTVTINTGSTTTGRVILAGSGQLDFNGTAPGAPAATGAGTGTITANSTDAVGQIGVDSQVANTALVLTFAKTYTVAPLCVFSGADAGAAAAIGQAAGVIVTSDATTMTLTYVGVAAAKTFNYHCFKAT